MTTWPGWRRCSVGSVDCADTHSWIALADCKEGLLKALTIRNIPAELAKELEQEKARRGASINRTVIELLSQGLGIGVTRSNGLAELAGRWSDEDLERFEQAVAPFGEVDAELWG